MYDIVPSPTDYERAPEADNMPGFFVLRPPPMQEEHDCAESINHCSPTTSHVQKSSKGRNSLNSTSGQPPLVEHPSDVQGGHQHADSRNQHSPTTAHRQRRLRGRNLGNVAHAQQRFVEHAGRTPTSRYPRIRPQEHGRGPPEHLERIPRRHNVPQDFVSRVFYEPVLEYLSLIC